MATAGKFWDRCMRPLLVLVYLGAFDLLTFYFLTYLHTLCVCVCVCVLNGVVMRSPTLIGLKFRACCLMIRNNSDVTSSTQTTRQSFVFFLGIFFIYKHNLLLKWHLPWAKLVWWLLTTVTFRTPFVTPDQQCQESRSDGRWFKFIL